MSVNEDTLANIGLPRCRFTPNQVISFAQFRKNSEFRFREGRDMVRARTPADKQRKRQLPTIENFP
jgi:hypothetical protein